MNSTPERNAGPVLCFGEILWDSVPEGLFPGGAPMNVAYHLRQLGLDAVPVTAVGADYLGEELLRRLKRWRLSTAFVKRVPGKQTGIVQVDLGERGSPRYHIVEDAAWDWIQLPEELRSIAEKGSALVFGTLAQRSPNNRKQFSALLTWAPRAQKIFDVNLRRPHDSPELVWELGKISDLIKLNHEELAILLGRSLNEKELEPGARDFSRKSGCGKICVTAGPLGAGLLLEDRWYWMGGRPIQVRDAIGAGDSFLAALVHGLLLEPGQPEPILYRACRLAEFVASQSGATPAYSVSATGEILKGMEGK
jgi:fructokinase